MKRTHTMLYRILLMLLPMFLAMLPTQAQQPTQIVLEIPSGAIVVGDEFDVVVRVSTDAAQEVDSAEAHIDFDTNILEVLSVTPGTALNQNISGPTFNNTSNPGTIDYAGGNIPTLQEPNPVGPFILMTVRFRAVGEGTSLLDFIELPAIFRDTRAFLAGVDLTGRADNPDGSVTVGTANTPPTADAGDDQTVTDSDDSGDETVVLDGAGSSDVDGTIVSYEWSWTGGTASGVSPLVTLPVGTTVITLTVTDDDGATDTDTVEITINEPENQAPTADAGDDLVVTDTDGSGDEAVTLDGSGSSDADGSIISYEWSWTGGTASGVSPLVTLPVGTTVITLTVTDDDGATDTDTVEITINEPENQAPTADAGDDLVVTDTDDSGDEAVTLDGSGSSDADGSIISYEWNWTGGTASGVSPLVTLPVGTTVITLTVTDDDGATDTDTVEITVNEPENQAPTADAGDDLVVTDTDDSGDEAVTLDGSGSSDADGSIISYEWNWTGGTASGVSPLVTLPVGTTVITLTVTDDDGATDTDTVEITINEPANQPPTIDPIADQSNTVGDSVSLQVMANDPEGEPLRYEANGLPAGLTIDAVSGEISGTIGEDGTFNVTITVIDSEGQEASTSFVWTVEEEPTPSPTTPAPTTPSPTTPSPTTPSPTTPAPTTPSPTTPSPTTPSPTTPPPTTPAPTTPAPGVEVNPLSVCWVEDQNGATTVWRVTNPNTVTLQPGSQAKAVFSWVTYDADGVEIQNAEKWDQIGQTRINTNLSNQIIVTWYIFDNGLSAPLGSVEAYTTEEYRCD